MNETEERFYDCVNLYQPYWSGEPVFDCTNLRNALPSLPCPPVDGDLLNRVIDFAVNDNWGSASTNRALKRRLKNPSDGESQRATTAT